MRFTAEKHSARSATSVATVFTRRRISSRAKGVLCVNRSDLLERAEILRDKGTNRQKFFRGQVDKYTWVDVGSAYVPCELVGAFLFGQLELMQTISERRRQIYEFYQQGFEPLAADGLVQLPCVPPECTSNFHLFYLLTRDAANARRPARAFEFARHRRRLSLCAVTLVSDGSPAGLRRARPAGDRLGQRVSDPPAVLLHDHPRRAGRSRARSHELFVPSDRVVG